MKNMTGVHISLQTFFQGCILKKWIHLLQKKILGKIIFLVNFVRPLNYVI